jgi:glycosyltransferase involved in cell wall biosynthesis
LKILIANKYHYMEGGPENIVFGLSEYLPSIGHEVIPFSVAYKENVPSLYEKYFLQPIGGGEETKLTNLKAGPYTRLRLGMRSIYSLEARRAVKRLIEDTKPDIMFSLNIVNHISPSIVDAAHECGVPVAMMSCDYFLVCANYLLLRNGQVCTECEHGHYYHALRHKCVQDSLAATTCKVAGMYLHKLLGIYKKVDAFITPARFTKELLIRAGFPADKMHLIPTFANLSSWKPRADNDGYILYFGRLTPEKGIDYLISAHALSGVEDPLVIVGDGSADYVAVLKSKAQDSRARVTFLGRKIGDELRRIVGGAKYVVVPSVWYDNAPTVIPEAYASGKPVIATALGGMCEQVTEETGILVEPWNVKALADAIAKLSASPDLVKKMGENARRLAEREYGIDTYAKRLLGLFSSIVS